MTLIELASLGVRVRRQQNKDLLHAAGYCTDCGNINDRSHYKRTCSKCLADASRYYFKNREVRQAKMKAWALANPIKLKEANKLRHAKNKWAVMKAYGGNCVCCGESNIAFLSIDHANGGGYRHRKSIAKLGGGAFYDYLRRNNYPNDPPLQVMCFNCNQGRQGNGGVCPHKGVAI